MKKPLIILTIIIVAIIAFLSVRHHQKSVLQQKFKDQFQSIPQEMKAELNDMQNDYVKLDILVNYPQANFYLDFKMIKDKGLPKQLQEALQERKGWMCPSFFNALSKDLESVSRFEKQVFLDALKEDQVNVTFKFRNAFGEILYQDHQILAECPEYLKFV